MIAPEKSRALFARARAILPGGVDSPVRAFGSVGGEPRFIERGEGAWLVDVDGNRYVDFMLSWGPLVLGHAHPAVVAAVQDASTRGTSYGAPSAAEVELGELIRQMVPSMEMLRFVNSGTEATMSALRVARAFTGRPKFIKFAGCYHGHADLLLVQAGSGVATLGLPDSPGVPPGTVADTLVSPFNDVAAVEALFAQFPRDIAAVIVEPVAGNMGVVPPAAGFLEGLQRVTTAHGALLIFDEVMCGFRVHPGGAQARYGVTPDLTTLGKAIGGGLPVGAYGGRRDVMGLVAPQGPVYQAGTLAGNPLAMAAGLATLAHFGRPGVWEGVAAHAEALSREIERLAGAAGVPVQVQRVGTMMTVFFAGHPVTDWESAKRADTARFARVFRSLLEQGVYWVPSQFEAAFLSAAHGATELDVAVRAFERALRAERARGGEA